MAEHDMRFLKDLLVPKLNQVPAGRIVEPVPEGHGIPRIIHQTFPVKALPVELRRNTDALKSLNPGWEYRFYDDDDIQEFIGEHYDQDVLNAFRRINPGYGAAKADVFRYLLMYACGGVYLDIKSSARKPFEEIFEPDDRYLLSVWKNRQGELYEGWGRHSELRHLEGGEFQQWYIACAPGHPFLEAVINTVLRNLKIYNPVFHGVGKEGVLRVTGPVAYTLTIARLLSQNAYRWAEADSDLGLQYSIYPEKSHRAIFGSHYSFLTDSIVKLTRPRRMSALAFGTVKRALSMRS